MLTDERQLEFEYADKILDLVYHADDFTTSDLQGAVEALVNSFKQDIKRIIIKN